MIVGLTGGIGSGKSTIGEIFQVLGVPVYEADAHSKNIIDTDKTLQAKLVDVLGADILDGERINRPRMAEIIFGNEELLKKTNALIHPAVGEHFKNWYAEQGFPYVIKEAAILFESGSYQQCDKIIVVSAPREMRIERVMKRGNMKREEVEARMNNQWPEEKKLEKADYIVTNDLEGSVIKQVIRIHEDLISQANTRS